MKKITVNQKAIEDVIDQLGRLAPDVYVQNLIDILQGEIKAAEQELPPLPVPEDKPIDSSLKMKTEEKSARFEYDRPGNTIGYHLNQMEEPERSKALANTERKRLLIFLSENGGIYEAIHKAFMWVCTPEGHEYWTKISKKYKHGNNH